MILRLVCLGLAFSVLGEALRIGAFNIQVFGVSKASDDDVMGVLKKIVKRYDIVFIQEIRDSSGKAIEKLLKIVNGRRKTYAMILSPRMGTTHSKEQYAYIYKKRTVRLEEIGVLGDPDHFERRPFAVKVNVVSTKVDPRQFTLLGIHVDPDQVEEELDALNSVTRDLLHETELDVLVVGDMNADCKYLGKTARGRVKKQWPLGSWRIDDDADTTTTNSDCAYDRIMVVGERLPGSIGKGYVYKFDKWLKLTQEEAMAVSDHYPVQVTL